MDEMRSEMTAVAQYESGAVTFDQAALDLAFPEDQLPDQDIGVPRAPQSLTNEEDGPEAVLEPDRPAATPQRKRGGK